MTTLKFSASAAYGQRGHFIARIKGRNSKYTFEYEFIGKASGKRGEYKSADVDDPGLYIERDIDRKGGHKEAFYVVAIDPRDGKITGVPCDKSTAMRLAKALDAGSVDWAAELVKLDPAPVAAEPVAPVAVDRAALETERAALVARLAEIDAELAK